MADRVERPADSSAHDAVAVVDIGTNSVLLLVAATGRDGRLRARLDVATTTRLGEGVDRTGQLAPGAQDRTLDCLRRYRELIREHGARHVSAIATSVLRDAHDAARFLERAEEALGARPTIVAGRSEAVLSFEGACGGLSLHGADVTLFDLGGGSTELVHGRVEPDGSVTVDQAHSADLGCVRGTERYLASDPPTREELDALRDEARSQLARWPSRGDTELVGVGGTVTSLVAFIDAVVPYDHDRVHGRRLDSTSIARAREALASSTKAERRSLAALEPRRADVIVAGALIVEQILARLGSSSVVVSDRGLRWGVAQRLVTARPVCD